MSLRLDDLQNGYRIFQDPDSFCFGMDAVLLSHYVKLPEKGDILDLCCGNGIIPILLAARLRDDGTQGQAGSGQPGLHFTGLELQTEAADLARQSVAYNGLADLITIRTGDLKEAKTMFPANSFSVVTCNPPYKKTSSGLVNPDPRKALARHEIACTLSDVLAQASYVLKSAGSCYLVHRPDRLADLFLAAEKTPLSIRRMRFVHPFADREPNLVLLELVKGGGTSVRVGPPLIVRNRDGSYTEELLSIYGMDGRAEGEPS